MNLKMIDSDISFVASLNSAQHDWYIKREEEREIQLRESLVSLSRALGSVSSIHSEILGSRLQRQSGS